MPANRFFIPTSFTPNTEATLMGEEWSHFSKVIRGREGDAVELINGQGQLAIGIAKECKKNAATLQILSVEQSPPACPPFALAQALPKQNRLEWILEKGTELGVCAFHLFPGALSEKKGVSLAQKKRYRHILISALKQSGRLDLPQIIMHPSLKNLSLPIGATFFGDIRKEAPLFQMVSIKKSAQSIYLVIGPEKGFSDQEVAYLDTHAIGVQLSPYILRAETAAIAAITLLAHRSMMGLSGNEREKENFSGMH